jgi:cytochrome c oxidase subunit 2
MSDAGKPEGDDYLLKVAAAHRPSQQEGRIITTAADVIHAWGVPSLGVKQDVPGFVRDTWFRADQVGDYYTASATSCAARSTRTCRSTSRSCRSRSTPPGPATRSKRRAGRRSGKVWELAPLVARRAGLHHELPGLPPDSGKGGGAVKPLDASPTVLDADKTKQIHMVLNSQNNGAMPAWATLRHRARCGHHVTKNHWSNATGQIVQPSEVAAARV